jgi:hypothetical protein
VHEVPHRARAYSGRQHESHEALLRVRRDARAGDVEM